MLQKKDIEYLHPLVKVPGATENELILLQKRLNIKLPEDYLDLLRFCNGADGEIGAQFWFVLWPANQVPIAVVECCVDEFTPGLVPFASDGGGTLFGIDARSGDPKKMSYCQFDAIVLDWDAVEHRCNTISEFLEYLATAD